MLIEFYWISWKIWSLLMRLETLASTEEKGIKKMCVCLSLHVCLNGCSTLGRGQLLPPKKHLCDCCLSNISVTMKNSKGGNPLRLCATLTHSNPQTNTVSLLIENGPAHVDAGCIWLQLKLCSQQLCSIPRKYEKDVKEMVGQTENIERKLT